MFQLINFLIAIIIFAIAAYGLKWLCEAFKLPLPAFWICGGVLIIIVLLFIANQVGVGGGPHWSFFPDRR